MPASHSQRPDTDRVEQALVLAVGLRPQLVATATRVLRHRDDAEGVVDAAIERLHAELTSDSAGVRDVAAWLRRVVLHRAIDAARAWVRRQRHLQVYGAGTRDGSGDDGADRQELHERVWRAILDLPRRQQEVVILRDMEGHSFREIGEALGIGEATARSHAHAAREELRQRLAAWRGGSQ
ncbi:MAG: RNA polymerase sigma factor [Planctomycetota bacterium]